MNTLNSFGNRIEPFIDRSQRFAHELALLKKLERISEIIMPILVRRHKRRSHSQVRLAFDDVERITGLTFPELTTEMIELLNSIADKKAREYYCSQYPGRSPLEKNGKEKDLTIFLDQELSGLRGIKLVPWVEPNSRKLMGAVPIVGIYCPDLIVLGIGSTGKAATIIEVDGIIHDTEKGTKDAMFDAAMRALGFDLIRIPASKVHKDRPDMDSADFDRKLCWRMAEEMKLYRRSSKVKVAKLLLKIKLLNIATWLSVKQIDHLIKTKFGIDFRLLDSIKIEFFRKNKPKWVKGARRLLDIRSPILSNGVNAKSVKQACENLCETIPHSVIPEK